MKSGSMRLYGRLLAIAAAAIMLAGCQAPEGMPDLLAPKAKVGVDRSPELTATNLPALNGPAKSLNQHKGQGGLMVVFVDTLCPFAETAVEGVDAVAATLAPHNIPVVVVNVDDSKSAVDKYYRKHVLNVPVMYDTTSATKKRWKITRVPTVVLVDAQGREAYVGFGQWSKAATGVETMLDLPQHTIEINAESTAFT